MIYLPLKAMKMFRENFEKKIQSYNPTMFIINDFEKAYVIEDSFILLVSFERDDTPVCTNAAEHFPDRINNPYFELPKTNEFYYNFVIEELTHNDLAFRFNTREFINELEKNFLIENLQFDVYYKKFKGFQRIYWCPEVETTAERIDRLKPDLHIRERYDQWLGNLYNYIVFEIDGANNKKEFAVGYTQRPAREYVNKLCREYIQTGKFGTDNTRFSNAKNFDNIIKSWRRIPRQERIEQHLRFYVIKEFKKEFDDVWKYADELLIGAQNGILEALDASSYLKPINRWVTEELVYNLTKKIWKNHHVIYQHRPYFLKSSIGGQMSYDIFISGLNIAIEYQGKQHFEPVDFFGGESGFERLKIRDEEKLKLSKAHGIKLIYINYWEEVSEELIKCRVGEIINS